MMASRKEKACWYPLDTLANPTTSPLFVDSGGLAAVSLQSAQQNHAAIRAPDHPAKRSVRQLAVATTVPPSLIP
jgi:hypothetical protein